jgi:hypothetical protein
MRIGPLRFLLFLLLLAITGGCAVFNRANTPALNFVEQHLVPKENPGRTLSYPLIIPVGFVATTVDMFLLHPVSVVDDAWRDTTDALWDSFDWQQHYVTTSASLLPRTLATPLIFTGDFLGRSSFDIPARQPHPVKSGGKIDSVEQQRRNREEALAGAREALDRKDARAALDLMQRLPASDQAGAEVVQIKARALHLQRDIAALAELPGGLELPSDRSSRQLIAEYLGNGTMVERFQLLLLLDRDRKNISCTAAKTDDGAKLTGLLASNLTAEDRLVRYQALRLLGRLRHCDQQTRKLLETIAKGDDRVMAAGAKNLLR